VTRITGQGPTRHPFGKAKRRQSTDGLFFHTVCDFTKPSFARWSVEGKTNFIPSFLPDSQQPAWQAGSLMAQAKLVITADGRILAAKLVLELCLQD